MHRASAGLFFYTSQHALHAHRPRAHGQTKMPLKLLSNVHIHIVLFTGIFKRSVQGHKEMYPKPAFREEF